MHDFDADRIQVWRERHEQDRTFQIGGETFTYLVAVPPEALLPWLTLGEDDPEDQALAAIDQTVLNFLEPGQEEKWRHVRRPDLEPPVTQRNLLDLCKWLMGEQAGRPTGTPSGSTPGSRIGATGTPLTDVSASPPAVSAG